MWYVRTRLNVRKTFRAVWDTDDLITDFGGAVVFRPVSKKKWRTAEANDGQVSVHRKRPAHATVRITITISRVFWAKWSS